MDYFKSDFLKVVMLIIVLFSFTTGGPKENIGLKNCKEGLDMYFGLKRPLLQCVEQALVGYSHWILPFKSEIDKCHYTDDVNEYYWGMHTYVSTEKIEPIAKFCERIGEFADRLPLVETPNYANCIDNLIPFEYVRPATGSFALNQRILFNALYYHRMDYRVDESGIEIYVEYKDAYMGDIISKIELMNDNDFTPEKFCEDRHKPKKKDDAGTSNLS